MQVAKWVWGVLVCVGLGCGRLQAAELTNSSKSISEPAGTSPSVKINADDTARNVRDRDNSTLTPADQGESKADLEMTAKIRRAIVKNDKLSVTAKNIKIITIAGKVTLRGPVKTGQERSVIEALVHKESPSSVQNELEVETAKK
jgi:hyperosmotically inducible protein